MGILKKQLVEKQKKVHVTTPGSVTDAICVPTGFDIIDYECATLCENDEGEEFLSIGFPMGKIILLAGNSQGGKTTFALQASYNMAKELNGDVVLLDFERASNNVSLRVRSITGCTEEEFDNMFTIFNQIDMSTEFFKKIIFDIAEMKKALNPKKDFVDHFDLKGNPIRIYPPTFVLVDSIPSVKPQEILEDPDLDNNMIPGKMAAANSAVLKSILGILEQYNITVIGI